ncbi:MAG: hypothetical protein LDL41_10380 [Coleofasciculus sp. S288]|nr:hypothetical protein [Coleofasciculus sp. S288]
MKQKGFYFPIGIAFVVGLILGIEITIIFQRFHSIRTAKACSKIPDGRFAVFVPRSNLVDRINLKKVVSSNNWAFNANCKLFKSKDDYIKESEVLKSSSLLVERDETTPPDYVKIPSERYKIKKIWTGQLIGYFTEEEANLVKSKILESTYKKEPDFVREPFVVNNINTNN